MGLSSSGDREGDLAQKQEDIDVNTLVDYLTDEEVSGFTPTPLESLELHRARRHAAIKPGLERILKAIRMGRERLLQHIAETWTGQENPPRPTIDDFKSGLPDSESGNLKGYLGISDQQLIHLYEAACEMYAAGQIEDSILAFQYLTALDTTIPELWSAQAAAYESAGKIDEALDCHNKAVGADLDKIESYRAMVDCCLRHKRGEFARSCIELAESRSSRTQELNELKARLEVQGG